MGCERGWWHREGRGREGPGRPGRPRAPFESNETFQTSQPARPGGADWRSSQRHVISSQWGAAGLSRAGLAGASGGGRRGESSGAAAVRDERRWGCPARGGGGRGRAVLVRRCLSPCGGNWGSEARGHGAGTPPVPHPSLRPRFWSYGCCGGRAWEPRPLLSSRPALCSAWPWAAPALTPRLEAARSGLSGGDFLSNRWKRWAGIGGDEGSAELSPLGEKTPRR